MHWPTAGLDRVALKPMIRFLTTLWMCVLLGLGVFNWLGLMGVAHAGASKGFCSGTQVRDLAEPFRALPKVHRFPASGRLPFGPSALEMLPIGLDRMVVGGGQVGAFLTAPGVVGVNWRVSASLGRLSKSGHKIGLPRHRSWTIKRIGGSSRSRALGFIVGGRQALYRFDASIRNGSGRLLGAYAEYFQVVRREVRIDLALNAATYRPGETLLVRLRNLGTAEVFFGYEVLVEKWTGVAWEKDPSTPTGWPLVGLSLRGGTAGACESVQLGSLPGEYRISKNYAIKVPGRDIPVREKFRIES